MRSYALLIFALAVLHARAATIPAPTEAEKLPNEKSALDDVSFDNNVSEQELSDQPNLIKQAENDIPEGNVPVEVIEEKPVLRKIALKEDSNDYVPDNDDSANIKRVEIDLNNPGPPERQEHDSQNPVNYVDKERAVGVVQKYIAESQNVVNRALLDVTKVFQNFATNKENLEGVQTNIQTLKENINVQVSKLSDTVNSYLSPESVKIIENADEARIEEVKNSLRTLKDKINTGMDMLSQGADVLSILKEEEETELPDKISGKADNVNVASTAAGPTPAPTAPDSATAPPAFTNPLASFVTTLQNQMSAAMTNVGNTFQNLFNINQNQNQQQQGTAPAGAQSDEAATTQAPNFFQNLMNMFTQGQSNQQQSQQTQNQNPSFSMPTFGNGPVSQFIVSLFQQKPQQSNQQAAQASSSNQPAPASDTPVQVAQVTPAPAQGSNSVPVAPAPQSQTVQNPPVQGPIQQIVQNNPIVKGITNAVQRIQGLSNPSTPRDEPKPPGKENTDAKGHGNGSNGTNANNGGNSISGGSGVDKSVASAPTMAEPETISEIKNEAQEPVAEPNKTE